MPNGIANGSSIIEPERSKIIVRLANGESVQAIADSLGHHAHTVKAVKQVEWQRIEARKPIITAQHEQAATVALDIINHKLLNGVPDDFSLTELNVVAGTSTDKMLALRGDASSTIRHIHSFDLSEDDIVAFAVSRSKHSTSTIEAELVPAPAPALNPPAELPPGLNHSNPAPDLTCTETALDPAPGLLNAAPGFIAQAKATPVKAKAKQQRKRKG